MITRRWSFRTFLVWACCGVLLAGCDAGSAESDCRTAEELIREFVSAFEAASVSSVPEDNAEFVEAYEAGIVRVGELIDDLAESPPDALKDLFEAVDAGELAAITELPYAVEEWGRAECDAWPEDLRLTEAPGS